MGLAARILTLGVGGIWTRRVLFTGGSAQSTGERGGRPDGRRAKPVGPGGHGQGR